jgi:hypothetical protein
MWEIFLQGHILSTGGDALKPCTQIWDSKDTLLEHEKAKNLFQQEDNIINILQ